MHRKGGGRRKTQGDRPLETGCDAMPRMPARAISQALSASWKPWASGSRSSMKIVL